MPLPQAHSQSSWLALFQQRIVRTTGILQPLDPLADPLKATYRWKRCKICSQILQCKNAVYATFGPHIAGDASASRARRAGALDPDWVRTSKARPKPSSAALRLKGKRPSFYASPFSLG